MSNTPEKPFGEVEASLEKTGRVDELIRLYESRSREVPGADEAAHLLCRAADLCREKLKNPVRAEELLRRALVYAPSSREALEGLRAIYEARGDAQSLASIFERLALLQPGDAAAALYLRAGELYETKLQRRDRAVLCYQLASRSAPQDRQTYRRARRLLAQEARYSPVFDSLERERAVLGDRELVDEYIAFAESLADYPQVHDLANRALERVLALDAKNARAIGAQRELRNLENVWRDRVKALKTQSLNEQDRRAAARLSLQVARLYAFYEPTAVDKVKEAIDRCFALWPAMPDALDLLEDVATRAGDVRLALTVFGKLAQDTRDKHARVDLQLRIGQVLLSKLNEPAAACEAFEQATKLDPSRPDAAELASEALIGAGRPEEGLAVLERTLPTLRDRGAQVALRLNLADLAQKLLKDPAKARVHVEEAFKLDGHNALVAWRLAGIYADEQNLDALWPLLELAVSAPRPLADRVSFCELVAMICEEADDPRRAFHALSLALPLDPAKPALLKSLTEAAAAAKLEPQLAQALRRSAQVAPPEAQPALWRALGQLLQRLERPAEAQEAWSEVQKRLPEDAEAAAALGAMRKAMAEAPQDPRSRLEAEARKLEASAADPAAAAALYRKILELDPDSVSTLQKLHGAASSLGQWEEAALVAERLLALAHSSEERQEWRTKLAQLWAERLGRREDAARLYLNLLDEGNEGAAVAGGLERLAAQGVRQADIARALAPVFARAGDYQRQVASLLAQLPAVQDRAEQKGLLSLLAETTEKRLLDERAAFDLRVRGLSLDPADSVFRAEAVRLAKALHAEQELARVLADLVAKVDDPALQVALCVEAAVLAEGAGAIDEASLALRSGLERQPEQPELLARLSELLVRTERLTDADPVLRRRFALAGGPEKLAVGLELSRVNAALDRPREAASALAETIKAGADEREHLPRLAQLLEQGGQPKELSEVQARLIVVLEQAGEKEQAAALGVQRARLLETALGDKAQAIARYADVLAAHPGDADAVAALENLLGDPEHREAAARALLPAWEAAGDHRKQVAVLNVIAEAAKDSLERIKALRRAAELHTQHLRQPEQAFAALATAARIVPGDAEVRAAARAAADEADALDSYAEVLEELLEEDAGPAAIALHRELADVYEKKLNQHEAAVKHLRAVLLLDAKHVEALRALQRLHRAREEWAELVPVIERLALLEADAAARSALDREAAVLAEQKLDDLERAAANWRLIAGRDVASKDAAAALDRLYADLDKPQELAFALELRRSQEGQGPQGRELAFRLAALRQNRLGDPRGALEVYRQILAEDPAHEGSRTALDEWARSADADAALAAEILDPVLAKTGDHQRRIVVREARLVQAAGAAERSKLSAEIRVILERDLGQPEAAFMNALKAFTDGLDRDAVQPELERLAKQTDAFDQLAEIYESTVEELPPGDEHALPLLRRAAELREQLGDQEEATRVWQLLLERVPDDRQALDSLGRLLERSQNARSLSEVYAKQAELAADPAERAALLVKAAEAFEASGEDGRAIEALQQAFALGQSREVLKTLERALGRAKRTPEQAEVLARLIEGAADAGEQLALVLRRAALLERDEQFTEALRAYGVALSFSATEPQAVAGLERLLAVESARLEAARLLEGAYRAANDARHLVEVLEVRLGEVEPGERLALLLEVGQLREALGQSSLALTARLRAFGEAPEHPGAREALERLATELGAFEELAAAWEDALERGVPAPLAGDLWRRLAVVYGERLSRFDLAARAWNEVLARDPKDAVVLEQLARIFRTTSQFRELAVVMRRQLGLETNPAAQVNLLFDLAALAEDTLSDKAMAAQCYQAVLEREPEEPNAIKFLGRILAETEQWPELARLLEREVQLAEHREQEEQALELLVRLGRLKLTRLGDPRGALTTFQEVLRRKPAHAGAVGALEEMARSDNPMKGEAASTLEPVFANEGEHLKLVQMLEAQVTAEPQPAERAALLRKMADVYAQQLDNPEMAFVVSARALREMPDQPENLALALTFFKKADAEDEMAALLAEVAPRAGDDTQRANLYRALAKLQAQADEEGDAIDSWKRVMEIFPTDAEAMAAVGQLYSRQGRVPELLEVLKRQLTIEEDPLKRAAVLTQMGVLQEEQLKDANSAIATFRKALELSPDDAGALQRMERLCEAQQRWPELADVLARRLKALPLEEQPPVLFKLAVVREAKLLDKQGALDLYQELLAQNPRHEGALQRLEALMQREPQNQQGFGLLAGAYRAAKDAEKLAQLIEARLTVSPDVDERKGLLAELAGLREGQAEPELAYLAYYRAFKEDPNDGELRKKLYAAASAAASYDELVSALQAELPRVAEPRDVAEVCLVIAQLSEQRLDEKEQAVVFYERAREAAPEAAGRALPALDRLYGELDFPDKQADVLEALAAMADEPADRVALSFRLGQLAMEKLDNPDRAAGAFEKVLQADPRHLPSLRSLEMLYEQAKASDKLYRVLEAQRDLVQGAEKDRLLQRMAMTSAEGPGADLEHSIKLYRELLEKNPRNDQAFDALSRLLERANKATELHELLKWKLQFTVDPRELVKLNERLGRCLWQQLEKPEEAVPFFKAALERDARHRGALESLRDIFDQLGKREDLVIVLRRLIPLQEDASGVKQIRIRLAEIIGQTARREEALDAARRALEVEPHQVAELERLYAVFTHLKAWPDAVRTLEAKAQAQLALEEREAAAQTYLQVFELWHGQANKLELAGAALEKVLELEPSNRQAYDKALELFQRMNDWRSYAQAMDRFLPNFVTDEEKVVALRELARVQEQKLGAKQVAFLQYCRALQLTPSDDELREQVERLAEETGSYDELAAVYEEVAETVPRGPLAERLYLTLARVQDQKLDDADAAEASLRRILEFDPTNEQALERMAAMFARRGQNKEYIVSLEQKLEAAAGIERRKEILREIARVYDEQMQDPGEAENALSRALELDPDLETLGVLVNLQRRQQNLPAVASTLLRMRDIAPTPEDRARLQVEVAQLYERDLQDDEAAIEGYRQALEFDPANATALASLEQLYAKLDRPAELLAVYERQLELTEDYRERVKILFRSAGIWEERYQNLANADACMEAALQLDPQNLQAIKTLERLRKAQGRWDELIGVVDRHIQLLASPEERAELCVEMGDIFHQQLKAVDRAAVAYHQALELDPRCRPAMHALGMLYERSGNWPFALDMLEREAQVLGATPEAVELWYRMGKINEDMLIDGANAKRCYLEALRIDAAYLPAIRALKGIYEQEQDFESYERALVEEARQTEDPEARSKAYVEVGQYYERKEDREQATPNYEEALKLDPNNADAARPLADIYLATEQWERCEQMLDIVVAHLTATWAQNPDDPEAARELCRRQYRLGYVCEKNGRRDKALQAFEQAYGLDATYLPVLEGYGNLLMQAGRFEEAQKIYQSILVHHRGDLTDLEVAEIYWTLGDLHLNLKQFDRAENHFEKALGIDPSHEPSLRSMVAISEQAQRFDKAAEFRQRLLEVLDGEAKFEAGIALGTLARDKVSDPYLAIDAFLAAHRVRQDALEVMDALYVLYRETRQGAKAAEMLEKMLTVPALQQDPQRAKRVWFALGELNRDELQDLDKATLCFNNALDADWRFVEAFSALEAMLGRARRWQVLDENYKRMIGRVPKTPDTHNVRMNLWKALGDLYLNALKAPDAAVQVYKVCASGLPDDVDMQEQYAALAQTQPGYEQEAIEAWRRALPSTANPGKVASALAELAAKKKDYDSAWLAAQVMAGLIGEAGAGEKEIITKLTPYAKKREVAQRQLTDRLWSEHLFHPKVRTPLADLLAILFEQAGTLYKEDFTRYGIVPKKHFIDVNSAQEYQIHHYRYVSRVLGMEHVQVFSPFLVTTRERMAKRTTEPAPDPMIGVEICHTDPVALRFGGKFFSETGQREVYYLLGRTMAYLRPELALTQRLSGERLEAVLQAAISLSVDRFRFSADPRAIDVERRQLERSLPPQARDALARVTREYVKVATPNDLRNFLEGAELSATRTGAFVAGEIDPVKRMVLSETGPSFRVQPRSKIRDLMVFALGEDLHALRVAVGTNVEVQLRK